MTIGRMSKRKSPRLIALWHTAFKTIEFTLHLFQLLFESAVHQHKQLLYNVSIDSCGLLNLCNLYHDGSYMCHTASYTTCSLGCFFVAFISTCSFPGCRSPPLVSYDSGKSKPLEEMLKEKRFQLLILSAAEPQMGINMKGKNNKNNGQGSDNIIRNRFTAYLITALHRKKNLYYCYANKQLFYETPDDCPDRL